MAFGAFRAFVPEAGTNDSMEKLISPGFASSMLSKMHKLYKVGSLCDFVVSAGGEKFAVHKNVLASASDYFEAMFLGQMVESTQGHVELKGITERALEILVNFAYTGELMVDLSTIEEVLDGASHIQMPAALKLCEEYLLKIMSYHTCVDIFNWSNLFSLKVLNDLSSLVL